MLKKLLPKLLKMLKKLPKMLKKLLQMLKKPLPKLLKKPLLNNPRRFVCPGRLKPFFETGFQTASFHELPYRENIMQGDLLPIVIGSIVGGLFGGILSIVILWVMSNKAQRTYPALSIPVPNGARYSPDFEMWAQLNKYRRTEENCYTKGRGLLTSATEIRFHGNKMEIVEVVNFLFTKRRFAINAPVMFGKPVRRHKIKQINKLLAHWQCPPIEFGKPSGGLRFNR